MVAMNMNEEKTSVPKSTRTRENTSASYIAKTVYQDSHTLLWRVLPEIGSD